MISMINFFYTKKNHTQITQVYLTEQHNKFIIKFTSDTKISTIAILNIIYIYLITFMLIFADIITLT